MASNSRRPLKREQNRKALIIVPTYNEIENLELIYQRIIYAAKYVDILVIDDGSPDGTGALADKLADRDKRVKVLHRPGKLGLGTAVVMGFNYALKQKYDLIVTIDADLSHDPSYIPQMLNLMKEYDLVIGSRYVRDGGMVNWSIRRLLISILANAMLKKILGIQQKDCSGAFKCYTADLLQKIQLEKIVSKGYFFYVEILYRSIRSGARIKEVPIIFVNRGKGKSKLGWKEIAGYAVNVLKLRFLTWMGKI